MIRALAICAALLPAPASALSCMAWTVESAFSEAEASEETYIVVKGDLSFDPDRLPKTNWANQAATPARTEIASDIQGLALTERGFTEPVETDLTLQIDCAGPWCPSPAPGPALVFLERSETGYKLVQGACGGFYFGAPTPEMLKGVHQCFTGGPCPLPVPR